MNIAQDNDFFSIAHSLQKRGFNEEEISLQLRQQGAADNILHEIFERLRNLRITKKRNNGFTYCGIGVALLVGGCIVTMLLYDSDADLKFALYGLTSLGVVFTIKGLADIMGW